MADAKSDSSNGPSLLGGINSGQDGSLSSNNFFARSKLGSSLLRPPQLKPVLGTMPSGSISNANTKEEEAKVEVEAPKFVPLGALQPANSTGAPPTTGSSAPPTAVAAFVFGQNLSERVMSMPTTDRPSLFSTAASTSVDHANTNGNSDLLFSTALHQPKETTQSGDGLAAAAAEYEAKHARALPLPTSASPPLTGEEGERNVLQLSCRLFAFETGAWRERGHGVLRLNDSAAGGGKGSRLVLRAAGSLRVLINTKVWPEMVVERAGVKSLRLTATDAQARVNVFLIMAGPDDIAYLFRALSQRVNLLKKCMPSLTFTPSTPSMVRWAPSLHLPNEEDVDSEPDSKNDTHNSSRECSDNSREIENLDSPNDLASREGSKSNEWQESNLEPLDEFPESEQDQSEQDLNVSSESVRNLKRKDETHSNEDGSPKRQCTK